MEDNDKKPKEGLLANFRKGLKKAVGSLTTSFSQSETNEFNDEFKHTIIEELKAKIASHYNDVLPIMNDITFTENTGTRDVFISSKIEFPPDSNCDIQEAGLSAEVFIPEGEIYHMPVPGTYGVDTFPPSPLPVYDFSPKINKMVLEITKSSSRSEIALDNVQESIKDKFPNARLIDKTAPLHPGNESAYCERLFLDLKAGSAGRKTYFLRQLRFQIRKVSVDRDVDGILFIKDFEFKLEPPESVFSLGFPGPSDIVRILNREKNIIRNIIFVNKVRGLSFMMSKMFFRMETNDNFSKIEPNENSTDAEISFNLKFNCVAGVGKSAVSAALSTVFYYTVVTGIGRSEEKTYSLRFVKRDNFELIEE